MDAQQGGTTGRHNHLTWHWQPADEQPNGDGSGHAAAVQMPDSGIIKTTPHPSHNAPAPSWLAAPDVLVDTPAMDAESFPALSGFWQSILEPAGHRGEWKCIQVPKVVCIWRREHPFIEASGSVFAETTPLALRTAGTFHSGLSD